MGGNGAKLGGSTAPTSNQSVSPYSTGGKIVDQGNGQWYGETDSGYGVSILDGGRDDINLYRYGSSQIYEVKTYDPDGNTVGTTRIATTKADAMSMAKNWLNQHK